MLAVDEAIEDGVVDRPRMLQRPGAEHVPGPLTDAAALIVESRDQRREGGREIGVALECHQRRQTGLVARCSSARPIVDRRRPPSVPDVDALGSPKLDESGMPQPASCRAVAGGQQARPCVDGRAIRRRRQLPPGSIGRRARPRAAPIAYRSGCAVDDQSPRPAAESGRSIPVQAAVGIDGDVSRCGDRRPIRTDARHQRQRSPRLRADIERRARHWSDTHPPPPAHGNPSTPHFARPGLAPRRMDDAPRLRTPVASGDPLAVRRPPAPIDLDVELDPRLRRAARRPGRARRKE